MFFVQQKKNSSKLSVWTISRPYLLFFCVCVCNCIPSENIFFYFKSVLKHCAKYDKMATNMGHVLAAPKQVNAMVYDR